MNIDGKDMKTYMDQCDSLFSQIEFMGLEKVIPDIHNAQ